MKQIIFFIFLFISSSFLAQTRDLPRNPEPGACYVKCASNTFDYNKPLRDTASWLKVNCNEVTKVRKKELKKENSIEFVNKLKAYQQQLKNLGYKLVVNGKIDYVFRAVHNKYLKDQKDANKKRYKILSNL